MERGNPLSAAAFCSISLCENVIHIFKKGAKFEKNALLCFTLFIASFRLFIFIFKMFPTQSPHILIVLCPTWNLQKRICHLCSILPDRLGWGVEVGTGGGVQEVWGQGELGVN